MTELNAKHHTLIQALLSRGPLKEDQFHRLFSDLTGENPGVRRKVFDDYLLRINKALSYVQFELKVCTNQYDGQVYYGVVNNVSDEESKLGTTYSVAQTAFYKAIIEAIVQEAAGQGTISSSNALNLRLENQVNMGTSSQSQEGAVNIPTALKNFSMSQKEKTLNEFVRDKWLSFTAEGNVGLGVRSFLDLRSWFHSSGVPSCEVCNEAGVKAVLCQNEGCTVRIHEYCLGKLFAKRKVERACPKCGTLWQYTGPKAEAVEDDEPDCTTQSQQAVGSKRKVRNRTGDGDIVESSSQGSLTGRNMRRSTRTSSRLQ